MKPKGIQQYKNLVRRIWEKKSPEIHHGPDVIIPNYVLEFPTIIELMKSRMEDIMDGHWKSGSSKEIHPKAVMFTGSNSGVHSSLGVDIHHLSNHTPILPHAHKDKFSPGVLISPLYGGYHKKDLQGRILEKMGIGHNYGYTSGNELSYLCLPGEYNSNHICTLNNFWQSEKMYVQGIGFFNKKTIEISKMFSYLKSGKYIRALKILRYIPK